MRRLGLAACVSPYVDAWPGPLPNGRGRTLMDPGASRDQYRARSAEETMPLPKQNLLTQGPVDPTLELERSHAPRLTFNGAILETCECGLARGRPASLVLVAFS